MLQVIQLVLTDVCQEGGGGGWLSDNRIEDIEANIITMSLTKIFPVEDLNDDI